MSRPAPLDNPLILLSALLVAVTAPFRKPDRPAPIGVGEWVRLSRFDPPLLVVDTDGVGGLTVAWRDALMMTYEQDIRADHVHRLEGGPNV